MYSFLFDRRSMALLLTGMAVAGLLLFSGGVFVGLQLQLDGSAPVTVAEFRPLGAGTSTAPAAPPTAQPAAAPPPVEPTPAPSAEPDAEPSRTVQPDPPAEPKGEAEIPQLAAAPAPAMPELVEQELLLAADPAADPAAQSAVLEGPSSEPRAVHASLPAPAEAPASPVSAPAVTPIVESVPVLTHGDLADSDGEPTFGVQVAAFELRSTAARIAAEFTRRGWDAYLVPFETPSGRQMYSIRFGRFSDGGEAYRAAREFEERERAPTLVRLQLRDD